MTTRIYQAPDALLFTIPIATNVLAQAARVAEFAVTTPSSRVQLKLSVIFWQNVTGQPSAIPNYLDPFFWSVGVAAPRVNTGLYLATADKDPAGNWRATTNIVGTIGPSATALGPIHTYQTIPVDGPTTGTPQQTLNGYSQTFQDGQDAIVGAVQNQIVNDMGAAHHGLNITLRARWEAQGTEICEDEWESLRQKMQLKVPDAWVYS